MAEVDEFELFRARSYGVESELRHQRASSVRVHSASNHGDRSAQSAARGRGSGKSHRRRGEAATDATRTSTGTTTTAEPSTTTTTTHRMTAAERKASFKSSSKRRAVCEEYIQEESTARVATGAAENRPETDGNGTAIVTDHTGDDVARTPETNGSRLGGEDDGCHDDSAGSGVYIPMAISDERGHRGVVFGGSRHSTRGAILLTEIADNDGVASSGDDDETCRVYRMRSFYTKSGNVVNRGDSVRVHGPKSRGGGAGRGSCGSPSARNNSASTRQTWAGSGSPAAGSSRLAAVADVSYDETADDASGFDRKQVDQTGADRLSSAGAYPTQTSELVTDKREFQTTPGLPENAGMLPSTSGRLLTVERRSTSIAKRRLRNESTDDGATGSAGGSVSSSTYRVLVIGGQGVGKTTLAQQIMTSEYLANKDSFTEDETGDQLISVQLDDEESLMHFIDIASSDMNNFKSRDCAADAHLVVYSVTDRGSFQLAQSCLQDLRPAKRHNVVILVGNKQDLVRNRIISEEEGKHLATKRHCKFIEVSALLNHKMDELLVGTLRQIRLRQTKTSGTTATTVTSSSSAAAASRQHASSNQRNRYHHQQHQQQQHASTNDMAPGDAAELAGFGCLQRAAMALFGKLFQRSVVRSTSCDDLFKP